MKQYKDIDLKFGMHPVTHDVTMKSGVWAVLQSVRNITMAALGDWETLPGMGAGLYGLLGENTTPTIQMDVQNKVEDALALYETRAELQSVEATLSEDFHTLGVVISFNVVGDTNIITDTVWLQRTN